MCARVQGGQAEGRHGGRESGGGLRADMLDPSLISLALHSRGGLGLNRPAGAAIALIWGRE